MTSAALIAGLPLAAGLDWLEALLPVLFALFWIGAQIVNALQKANRRPPPVRPARPAAVPPRDTEIRAELDRQIEEFLGRSQPRAERPPARKPQPVDRRARRAAGETPPPLPAPAATPPSATGRRLRPAGGSDVARHVHDAFAHELEHLTSSLQTAAPAGAEQRRPAAVAPAAELAAALREPATLRQLILLREVLDRPVDRW